MGSSKCPAIFDTRPGSPGMIARVAPRNWSRVNPRWNTSDTGSTVSHASEATAGGGYGRSHGNERRPPRDQDPAAPRTVVCLPRPLARGGPARGLRVGLELGPLLSARATVR